jgi:hypothetical protein
MLKIKHCTIHVPEDRVYKHSGITVQRIQKILSAKFAHLDPIEGKIRFKNIQLDLGSLPESQFQFQFYKKLEVACSKIVKKISLEQVKSTALTFQSLQKKASENTKNTPNSDWNLLQKFLEDLTEFPKITRIDIWEELYAKKHQTPLPEKFKELIIQLLKEDGTTSNKFAEKEKNSVASDLIKNLLRWMTKVPMNTDWAATLISKYHQQTQQELPENLTKLLYEIQNEINGSLQLVSDQSEENTTNDSIQTFLKEWLSKNEFSSHWLENFNKDSQQFSGHPLSSSLKKLLSALHKHSTFSEEFQESGSSIQNTPNSFEFIRRFLLDWIVKNPITKSGLQNLAEEYESITGRMFPIWVLNFLENLVNEKVLLQKSEKETDTLLWFQEKWKIFQDKEATEVRQIHAFLHFAKAWIETHKVSGNWQDALIKNYEETIKTKISEPVKKRWNQILSDSRPKSTKKEKDALVELFREQFARQSAYTTEATGLKQKLFEFLLNWLITNELSAHWIKNGLTAFQESQKILLTQKQYKSLFKKVQNLEISTKVNSRQERLQLLAQKFQDQAKKPGRKPKDSQEIQEFIFNWVSENSFAINWISQLHKNYKQTYGKSLPSRILKFLKTIQTQQTQTFTETIKRNTKVKSRQERLQLLAQKFQDQAKKPGRKPKHFQEIQEFIFNWVSENSFAIDWVSQLHKNYKKTYGKPLSAGVLKLLKTIKIQQAPTFTNTLKKQLSLKIAHQLKQSKTDTIPHSKAFEENTQEHYLLSWLSKHALSEDEITQLTKDFEKTFQRSLPSWVLDLIRNLELKQESRFNQQFSARLKSAIHEHLRVLKNNQQGKETHSVKMKAIQEWILDWISLYGFSKQNFKKLSQELRIQFGSDIPVWIDKLLENTSQEYEKALNAKSQEELTRQIKSILHDKHDSNGQVHSNLLKTSHKAFIFQWLSSDELKGNWLKRLQHNFIRNQGSELPKWILKLLQTTLVNSQLEKETWYQKQWTSLLIQKETEKEQSTHSKLQSSQDFLIQWLHQYKLHKLGLRSLQEDYQREFKDQIPQPFFEKIHEYLTLSGGLKKQSSQKILIRSISEVERNTIHHVVYKNKAFLVDPSVQQFLLHWIRTHTITENWISKFQSDYQKVYREELPDFVKNLLLKHHKNIQHEQPELQQIFIDLVNSEIQLFTNQQEHAFNTKSQKNALSLDISQEFSSRNPNLAELISQQKFKQCLLDWLGQNSLSDRWPSAFKNHFEETFSQELPNEYVRFLDTLERVASKQVFASEPSVVESVAIESYTHDFIFQWLEKHPLDTYRVEQIRLDYTQRYGTHFPVWLHHFLDTSWDAFYHAEIRKRFQHEVSKMLTDLPMNLTSLKTKNSEKSKDKNQRLDGITNTSFESGKSPVTKADIRIRETQRSFILHWLNTYQDDRDSLEMLRSSFRQKFDDELPSEIYHYIKKIRKRIVKSLPIQSKQKEWIAKLKNVLTRDTSVKKTKEVGFESLSSSELSQRIQNFQQSFAHPIFDDWSAWIALVKGKKTYKEWQEILQRKYRHTYKTNWSQTEQLLFIELYAESNTNPVNTEFGNWRKQLLSYLKEQSNDADFNDYQAILKVLIPILKTVPFNAQWYENLMQLYSKKQGETLPISLQTYFFEFRKKQLEASFDKGQFEASFTAIDISKKDLASFLTTLLPKETSKTIAQILAFVTKTQSATWLNELLMAFKKITNQEMSLQAQVELIHWASKKQHWTPYMVQQEMKRILLEQLKQKERGQKKKTQFSRLEVFQFLKHQLAVLNLNANWQTELEENFSHKFKHSLPKRYAKWIQKEIDKQLTTQKKSASKNRSSVALSFIRYLEENRLRTKSKSLIKLFDALPKDFNAPWFPVITQSYRKTYGENIPLEWQKVLLEFVKYEPSTDLKVEQNTEVEIQKEILLTSLNEKINTIKIEEQEWSEQSLNKLNQWIKTSSWETLDYEAVKSDYEGHFQLSVPEWLKQIFMRHTSLQTPVTRIQSASTKKKRKRPVASEKAKLLKLKKQIEKMRNEKDIPDAEIIQDAGILLGWVLWKKYIDQFGWLKEGKFYKKDGCYTGTLAANWLTRLGVFYEDSLNPITVLICDLLSDERDYLSDQELESYMDGQTLEHSVSSYYQTLRIMWPILQMDQKAEFIELFVQREGVLTSSFFGWDIAIVEAPQDALLTKTPIPWPLTIIKFPWTSKSIDISW